jgi:hypothetical protein
MAQSEKQLWSTTLYKVKQKCTADEKPFSLTTDFIVDLASPMVCRITGRTLKRSGHTDSQDSPVVVPIVPSLGYVPDNVIIVAKSVADALNAFTLDELRAVLKFKVATQAPV